MDFKLEIQDKCLSVQQVADTLKIDYATARRWLRANKLPSIRIANRIFGRKDEIEALALEFENTVTVEAAAKMIDRAPRTVNHLIIEGDLRAVKWMRRWYILESSIEEYLEVRGAKNA